MASPVKRFTNKLRQFIANYDKVASLLNDETLKAKYPDIYNHMYKTASLGVKAYAAAKKYLKGK